MINGKMNWLPILALLAAKCNSEKLNMLYHPQPQHAGTSGGSLFLAPLDPSTMDSRANEIPEHGEPGSIVKAHERNTFKEPDLEFGPPRSHTKFLNNGEIPTGSFGRQPTDTLSAMFVKPTIPERPERHPYLFDRSEKTDYQNDVNTFKYRVETESGITADVKGSASHGVESEGGYSYTGDDGKFYSVRYTAGKNGFVPRGNHLPTPPPIPIEIQRALVRNAKDEANGVFDDGSYDLHKYPGIYHYDPVQGALANDIVDNVNNHNHIHSHVNEEPANGNHGSLIFTDSAADTNLGQGNNNLQNLNAAKDDTVVTDAAASFPGFRSLEDHYRSNFKGPQYLPPVMNNQHIDIGAPTILGSANRRVMLQNKQPRYTSSNSQNAIVLPRNLENGY